MSLDLESGFFTLRFNYLTYVFYNIFTPTRFNIQLEQVFN